MKTKQLNKIIEDNGEEYVFGTQLDTITQNALVDHFRFRYACDSDEMFAYYMKRNISESIDRYNALVDFEGQTIDPLLIDLKTRTAQVTKSGGQTESIVKTLQMTGSQSKEGSLARKTSLSGENVTSGTSHGENTYSSSDSSTRTDNLTHGDSGTSNERTLHSDTPQTNVSANTSQALGGAIAWNYATDLVDSYETHNNTQTDTGTQSQSGSSSGTGKNDTTTSGKTDSSQSGTTNDTTKETIAKSGMNSEDINTSRSDNSTGSTSESLSGRSGHLVSEICDEWERYIKKTKAFLWLCSELEKCFMSNLLYGEEGGEY